MAFFSNDRLDEMRFRSAQSPRDEAQFHSSHFRPDTAAGYDPRSTLQRRFTTNAVPTLPLSPIGLQRRQAAESTEMHTAAYHKVQLLEKKKKEYEALREQRRRFQTEMDLLDLQSKRDADELARLSSDISLYSGHQSEPTTPPEYREAGFPTSLSRPNRYSTQSLMSPNGKGSFSNRPSRSGSQALPASNSNSHLPPSSVPGSRPNSDEDDDDDYEFDLPTVQSRTGAALNRISLPLAASDYRALGASDDAHAVTDFHNIAASILDDDATSLQMDYTKDKFPTLIRRRPTGTQPPDPGVLAAAQQQSPDTDKSSSGWPAFSRHRQGQQSMPANVLRKSMNADDLESAQISSILDTPTKTSLKNQRLSMEVKANPYFENKRSSLISSPPNGLSSAKPNLQSSYSTNDIPTMKASNGITTPTSAQKASAPPKSHAEQHYHNHNASIGRIPATANRHSRDLSGDVRNEEAAKVFRPLQSALQANAPSFGPASTAASASTTTTSSAAMANNSHYGMSATGNPGYYNPYNMMPMVGALPNMNNIGVGGSQAQWNNQIQQMQMLAPPFDTYNRVMHSYSGGRYPDSQQRVISQRRAMQNEDNNARYANLNLEQMRGQIYQYCKDQHGCRFLQKKLEERNPDQVQLIFEETKDYVVELMQDPFGNYLCQKLLEFANDDQRTALIGNAMPEMVKIALNQHGTRALQKMIEFISLDEQVNMIIIALKDQVVQLIQDLNGNHVIQKCLNHLRSSNCQFIYDAVGMHCVVVGTHRHGCCVLQRCIDHASGQQRAQLVHQITANAFALVQDPFGNYVVQYILDLGETAFSQPLCMGFRGSIATLSKQKFSSNVIEKCIRVSDKATRAMMIEEIMNPVELSKMANDSFANYVVQTAIEYADEETKSRFMEEMKGIVSQIRNTPHGRRFMQKIQDYENQQASVAGAQMAIQSELSSQTGSGPATPYHHHRNALSQSSGFPAHMTGYNQLNGFGSPTSTVASPQPRRLSNPALTAQFQPAMNQQQQPQPQQQQQQQQGNFPGYGRNGQPPGLGFF